MWSGRGSTCSWCAISSALIVAVTGRRTGVIRRPVPTAGRSMRRLLIQLVFNGPRLPGPITPWLVGLALWRKPHRQTPAEGGRKEVPMGGISRTESR